MSERRSYTVEEANELLPYLAPTLVELRRLFAPAVRIRARIAAAAATNGKHHGRDDWTDTLARVNALLDRIRSWQVVLRDIDSGLVDFPAIVDGEPAFLCWRLGEERVAHWHRPDEGFAGRRPL